MDSCTSPIHSLPMRLKKVRASHCALAHNSRTILIFAFQSLTRMSYEFASELCCVCLRSQLFIESGRVSTFVRIQQLTRTCTVQTIPLQNSILVCLDFAFRLYVNIVLAHILMCNSVAMQSLSALLKLHCSLLSLHCSYDFCGKTCT